MAIIGEKVKQAILDQVEQHLDTYIPAMAQAYDRFDDGLTVNMAVKLTPNERDPNSVDVKTGIAFKLDQVKDDLKDTVSEVQLSIPGMEKKVANG